MSRNSILLTAVLFVVSIIFIILVLPALAAAPAQETTPPERMRPDQYSYHGKEDLPYLPGQSPSNPAALTIDSPVDQWSKMTFESFVVDNWEIYYANGNFTNLVRLTSTEADTDDIHPRLNRGGTRIVFASNRVTRVYDIYTMYTDGTHIVNLSQSAADDVKPAWSPDGTRIAFQSYRDGNAEVYVMNADGTGQTNLTNNSDYDGEPYWSPDGAKIAFSSRRTGGYRIYVMNADGTNPVMLSQQAYSELPVWSPDGSKIGYDADSDNDGWQELWTMNADGSLQSLLNDPSTNATIWANGWSPDGTWLTYTYVHMVYYYGYWYWDNAGLYGILPNTLTYHINPGRDTDWNLDWTTLDIQPPVTGMNSLYPTQPYQFTVSWWGQDTWSGMSSYSVQVRDGQSGTWIDWQLWTTETSAVYTGVGGHDYYFRLRGRDQGFTTQPWPADYQVYTRVESLPPTTRIKPLNPFIYGDHATVVWDGDDVGGSGILTYDLQYKRDSDGVWQNWLSGTSSTSAEFTGEPGHTYYFRSRGKDNALNVEEWPAGDGDTSTSFYSWRTVGTVRDNTGISIAGAEVSVDPPAFLSFPSDINGKFSAFLGDNPPQKSVTWSKDGYGALPPTIYGTAEAIVDVYLPPMDNQVQDWGFESGSLPGVWQVGGTITPTVDIKYYHSGSYATSLGTSPQLTAPALIGNVGNESDTFDPFAIDQHGGVHLAWGNWDNGSFIYYAHRLPDGTWLPAELAAQPAGNIDWVKLTVDADDIVHLFYVTDTGIYYIWRDVTGTWSSPYFLDSHGWLSRVIVDPQSTIHVIIPTQTGLVYAYLPHAGSWQVELVPFVNGWTNRSDLAVDSSGKLHLVWTPFADDKAYYMMRQNDGVWADPVLISKMHSTFFINILLDSSDAPHVVWKGGDVPQLYYSSMNEDGNWKTPYLISEGTGAGYYRFFIDNRDTLYAAWAVTNWDIAEQGIYFSQLVVGRQWTAPYKISTLDGYPAGDIDATAINGNVYLVWSEDLAGVVDVFYSTLLSGIWNPPQMLSVDHISSSYPRMMKDALGGINIAWAAGGLYYIGMQPVTQSGDSWLSQSLTVPVSITHPTLSFLASLSGVSDISGDIFSLQVSTGSTDTTIFSSTTPGSWEHDWFDLSPWSGQAITLTFQLTQNAGFPPASALLDEVTLGEAHSDVWVDLSGGARIAHPGDQFSFLLGYGNHGDITASATVMTMTLPVGLSFVDASLPPQLIGNQLVWQLGDLPPGADPDAILITVEVDASAPLPGTVITGVEIATSSPEIELLNNTSHSETYLAYLQILPLIRR